MRIAAIFILAKALIHVHTEASPDCSFAKGDVPLSSVRDCFASVPANSANATSTLRTVNAVIQEYSFLSLYNQAGPPYDFQQKLLQDLSAMSAAAPWGSDWEFHDKLARIFNRLHDAHTVYMKPACYNFFAYLPLSFIPSSKAAAEMQVQGLSIGGRDVTAEAGLSRYIGHTVMHIDGFDPFTAISAWADSDEAPTGSQDQGTRFTMATTGVSFTFRSLRSGSLPAKDYVALDVLDPDSKAVTSLNVSWKAIAPAYLGANNFTASCAAVPTAPVNCSAVPVSMRPRGSMGMTAALAIGAVELHSDFSPVLAWAKSGPPSRVYSPVTGSHRTVDVLHHYPGSRSAREVMTALGLPTMLAGEVDSGAEAGTEDQQGVLRRVDVSRPLRRAGGGRHLIAHAPEHGISIHRVKGVVRGYGSGSVGSSDVAALTLSTFLPPSISNCFALLGFCPTRQQQEQASACLTTAIIDIVKLIATAKKQVSTNAARALVIDVRGNGGGSVLLSAVIAATLMPSSRVGASHMVMDMPVTAFTNALLEQAQARNLSLNLPIFGALDANTGQPIGTDDLSWYTQARTLLRGGVPTDFTRLFTVVSTASVASLINAVDDVHKYPLSEQQQIILTDGRCGSACAQFVKVLQQTDSVTTVSSSGLPRVASDTGSFAGGFIVSDGAGDFVKAVEAIRAAGGSFPAGMVLPERFPTSAKLTLNWAEAYPLATNSTPAQFYMTPAAANIPSWIASTDLFQQAADAVETTCQSAAGRLALSTGAGWLALLSAWAVGRSTR